MAKSRKSNRKARSAAASPGPARGPGPSAPDESDARPGEGGQGSEAAKRPADFDPAAPVDSPRDRAVAATPAGRGRGRWVWGAAAVVALAAAALLGWYRYRVPGPAARFAAGRAAVAEEDWPRVHLAISALMGLDDFAPQRNWLELALQVKGDDFRAALQEFDELLKYAPLRADTLTLKAQALYKVGRYGDAERCLEDALEADPAHPMARTWLDKVTEERRPLQAMFQAVAAIQRGDAEARETAVKAIGTTPDVAPYHRVVQGVALMGEQKFLPALEEFGYAVNFRPVRTMTLTLSGECLLKLGRFSEALPLFYQAIDSDPDAINARRWLAAYYHDQGANDLAAGYLREVAELDPQDPRPHRLLGQMSKDFENFDLAIPHYQESLRRGLPPPMRWEVLVELAETQVRLRKYREAQQTLSDPKVKSLENPELAIRRDVVLAECALNLDGPQAAEPLVEAALKAAPDNLAVLQLAGTVALANRDSEKAVAYLRKATETRPSDYSARINLAQALRRTGQDTQADAELKVAEELKQLRTEFSQLHEVANAEVENADVRVKLGRMALKMDLPGMAGKWFQAALAIQPDHPEAQAELKKLTERKERKERANDS